MKKALFLVFISILPFLGKSQNQDLALHFTGQGTYVKCYTLPTWIEDTASNGYTIDFWMQSDGSLYGTYCALFSFNDYLLDDIIQIRVSDEFEYPDSVAVLSTTSNGVQNNYYSDNTSLGDGNCHHIAFTYNDGTCNLYIDGILEISKTFFFSIQHNDLATLGAIYYKVGGSYSQYYNGFMDNFRFWNYPMNNSEIAEIADPSVAPSNEGLIIHYTFNNAIAGGSNDDEEENDIDIPYSMATLEGFDFNSNSSNYLEDPCSVYDGTVTIETEDKTTAFKVFQQNKNLTISSEYTGEINLSIYELTGKLIQSNVILHSYQSSIPTQLKTGIYIIKITTNQNKIYSHKVMWQH